MFWYTFNNVNSLTYIKCSLYNIFDYTKDYHLNFDLPFIDILVEPIANLVHIYMYMIIHKQDIPYTVYTHYAYLKT